VYGSEAGKFEEVCNSISIQFNFIYLARYHAQIGHFDGNGGLADRTAVFWPLCIDPYQLGPLFSYCSSKDQALSSTILLKMPISPVHNKASKQ